MRKNAIRLDLFYDETHTTFAVFTRRPAETIKNLLRLDLSIFVPVSSRENRGFEMYEFDRLKCKGSFEVAARQILERLETIIWEDNDIVGNQHHSNVYMIGTYKAGVYPK